MTDKEKRRYYTAALVSNDSAWFEIPKLVYDFYTI